MSDLLSMFRQTLEMEAKALDTPDYITINRALEFCASAYQFGVKESDWEALRNQAAIAAMQGMLSNTDTINQYANDEAYKNLGSITDVVAKASVMYADALIEELKHPKV